jgi:hypothetical protein
MTAGGGASVRARCPVWCYCTDIYDIYIYIVLKVADIQRPIEANIFFGVGRCIQPYWRSTRFAFQNQSIVFALAWPGQGGHERRNLKMEIGGWKCIAIML